MTELAPQSSTSTSLIDRAKAANPEAWERLAKLYGPLVYSWARTAKLQPDDASDIMQSVFHSLTKNIVQFQRRTDGDSFRGWLYSITRNKIHDHFRRQQKQGVAKGGTVAHLLMQELPENPEASGSASATFEINGLKARALQLVQGEFEGRTWVAFWRTAVEGDTPADVAADMGMSVWSVYKAKSRVLQRLREEFEELLS